MNDHEPSPGVGPPRYLPQGPAATGETLLPYSKNEGQSPEATSQPLDDGSDNDSTALTPTGKTPKKRTQAKRIIAASLVLLAIVIAATVGGVYASIQQRRAQVEKEQSSSLGPIRPFDDDDQKDEEDDPSKTGPQPDSSGPPVLAMAFGFNRTMESDNADLSHTKDALSKNWIWYLSADGYLSRKVTRNETDSPVTMKHRPGNETESAWITTKSRRFLTAPLVAFLPRNPGNLAFAFALEASTGALLYSLRDASGWETGDNTWHSLGGRFTYPPTVLSNEVHGAEVHAVTESGQLWRRTTPHWSHKPKWNDWEYIGDGFTGEVNAHYLYSFGYQSTVRAAAVRNGTYQVLNATLTYDPSEPWKNDWEDYGRPSPCTGPLGVPKLVSSAHEHIELIAECGGKLWHKFVTTTLDAGWNLFEPPGGEDLVHDSNALMLFTSWRNDGPGFRPPYLVSHTHDHCFYSTLREDKSSWADQGRNFQWGPWRKLWCQTEEQKRLATTMACDQWVGRCDVYREDANGRILHSIDRPVVSTGDPFIPHMAPSMEELSWKPLEGRVGE